MRSEVKTAEKMICEDNLPKYLQKNAIEISIITAESIMLP